MCRINTDSSAADIAFQDDELDIGNGPLTLPIGGNGLKIYHGYLYLSNTNQKFFGRMRITDHGDRTCNIEKIAELPPNNVGYDDFSITKDGTTYIAVHNSELIKITEDGKQTVIAGNGNGLPLYNPSSAALSRSERSVYVSTEGETINGTTQGAQVVEVFL